MSLPADWNVAANVGGGAVFEQEAVAADEDLPQPLEDLGVVDDLVLDQALRDVEGHLGAGGRKTTKHRLLSWERKEEVCKYGV